MNASFEMPQILRNPVALTLLFMLSIAFSRIAFKNEIIGENLHNFLYGMAMCSFAALIAVFSIRATLADARKGDLASRIIIAFTVCGCGALAITSGLIAFGFAG